MSSVLTDDEDLIMEAYDAATERLSRALEMNPGKISHFQLLRFLVKKLLWVVLNLIHTLPPISYTHR